MVEIQCLECKENFNPEIMRVSYQNKNIQRDFCSLHCSSVYYIKALYKIQEANHKESVLYG